MDPAEKAARDRQMQFDHYYAKAADALLEARARDVMLCVRREEVDEAKACAQDLATAAKILADALVQARGETNGR